MNLTRCPVCHSHITLEAIVQDEAGRELMAMLANLEGDLSRALVTYLGLFRPEKRDLSNDRALRIAKEVMALTNDSARLSHALAQTVETLRAKDGLPLKNHNYLRKVMSSLAPGLAITQESPARLMSKTEQALIKVEKIKAQYRE
ncbi:MAG TPA: hypothetical protein PL071_09470 [Nitrosomonas sp.]|nr:hypothetical protein [Nitrosomonas sp.]